MFCEAERHNLFMASGHQVKEICVHSNDRKREVTCWCSLCSVVGNADIVLAPDCRRSWNLPCTISRSIFIHVSTKDSHPEMLSSDICFKNSVTIQLWIERKVKMEGSLTRRRRLNSFVNNETTHSERKVISKKSWLDQLLQYKIQTWILDLSYTVEHFITNSCLTKWCLLLSSEYFLL